jgi:hypothetical protein
VVPEICIHRCQSTGCTKHGLILFNQCGQPELLMNWLVWKNRRKSGKNGKSWNGERSGQPICGGDWVQH